ncbi:hypothetical protein ABT282_08535 [Streptomyces sp. NPDC000927]|uniref:hypothetical protein n=1 Tax=Streptomyces sp. NPDC000927 TaxID=3154371 RepID=UPI003322DB40
MIIEDLDALTPEYYDTPTRFLRSVQRRMPTASYSTIVEFSGIVYSVAQNRGSNTAGAYKDFLSTIDNAVKSGEEWACEANRVARICRTRKL